MRLVRNKLAYHLEQDVLDAAFLSIPSNYQLADFHTGLRGTTFFGVADTAAAAAIAQLIGASDIETAVAEMIEAATAAIGNLQDFADGYLVAFYLTHFGIERLNAASSVRLEGCPKWRPLPSASTWPQRHRDVARSCADTTQLQSFVHLQGGEHRADTERQP